MSNATTVNATLHNGLLWGRGMIAGQPVTLTTGETMICGDIINTTFMGDQTANVGPATTNKLNVLTCWECGSKLPSSGKCWCGA